MSELQSTSNSELINALCIKMQSKLGAWLIILAFAIILVGYLWGVGICPVTPSILTFHVLPGSSSCVFWSIFCTLVQGQLLPRCTAFESERCSTSPQTAFNLIQGQDPPLHKLHSISPRHCLQPSGRRHAASSQPALSSDAETCLPGHNLL